jgi:hypothetical protein
MSGGTIKNNLITLKLFFFQNLSSHTIRINGRHMWGVSGVEGGKSNAKNIFFQN